MKLLLSIGFFVLFLDQLTKYFFKDKVFVISSFLKLEYVENTGAAFGMLKGFSWLFIVVAFAVLVFILWNYKGFKKEKSCFQIALGCLFGGVLGNLIDRLFLGYVRDFIAFSFWPTFNVADAFSTIAVIILIVYTLISKKVAH
ncbi:MAG: signal peptidase II [Nanoarchaeota archaeon]|nr:signal peptidase II [Nanoarchaeota archaeon]